MVEKPVSLFREHQSVSLQKFQSFLFAFAVIRLSGAVTLRQIKRLVVLDALSQGP